MHVITLDEVISTMHTVVERVGPDYRNPENQYASGWEWGANNGETDSPVITPETKCCCFIGATLFELGASVETLVDLDAAEATIQEGIGLIPKLVFTPEAVLFMAHAQEHSDGRAVSESTGLLITHNETWARALEIAEHGR